MSLFLRIVHCYRYSLSLHVRFDVLPKGRDLTALLATLEEDSTGSKAKAFVFVDAKGNVRFGDGTALFGSSDGVIKIKPMHWAVISVAVDAIVPPPTNNNVAAVNDPKHV